MPVATLIVFSAICALIYGWVMNIIWIATQQSLIWNGEAILSVVGIFIAPLGAILGLFVH